MVALANQRGPAQRRGTADKRCARRPTEILLASERGCCCRGHPTKMGGGAFHVRAPHDFSQPTRLPVAPTKLSGALWQVLNGKEEKICEADDVHRWLTREENNGRWWARLACR